MPSLSIDWVPFLEFQYGEMLWRNMLIILLVGAVANYCDEYVCVFVCLSACEDISWTTNVIFTKFFVRFAYGLWHGQPPASLSYVMYFHFCG